MNSAAPIPLNRTSPAEQLKQLVRYSEAMLQAAEQDDWDTVADIEQKRHTFMPQFFDGHSDRSLPEETLRRGLVALKNMEDELVARATQARADVASELQGLGNTRRAVNAYTGQPHPG
ncbi:MAG TPA: flagellar protein FliT [Candidatus Tenderia sp.]|nr:flagellar protein FliT [Candidatus Tenderia sp.]